MRRTTTRGTTMQTPNDHLRALLLELAEQAGLSDSAIARAHNRAYKDSTLSSTTIFRFRTGTERGVRDAPTELHEEAYAAATGTTRQQNWREAFRRWEESQKSEKE